MTAKTYEGAGCPRRQHEGERRQIYTRRQFSSTQKPGGEKVLDMAFTACSPSPILPADIDLSLSIIWWIFTELKMLSALLFANLSFGVSYVDRIRFRCILVLVGCSASLSRTFSRKRFNINVLRLLMAVSNCVNPLLHQTHRPHEFV